LAITSADSAGAHLIWQGPVNGSFSIEATVSLSVVAWQAVTNFVSTNSVMMFNDPAATNYATRFYRAKAGS
jgi:hypothetical protein